MSKKAQGLSINVVIVAAIALIVLVVLVAIFTGRLGFFGKEVSDVGLNCEDFKNNEGVSAKWKTSCGDDEKVTYTAKDAGDNPVKSCCIPIDTE